VLNLGNGTLTVGSASLSGTDAAEFAIGSDSTSGASIGPMGSTSLQVTFSPANAGAKTATLSIPSDDPDENPVTIALAGTGTSPSPSPEFTSGPDINVSPVALDFGRVKKRSKAPPQLFTVQNLGTADLTVGTATITGPNAADFTLSSDVTSGAVITPLSLSTLEIVFKPTGKGARSASLEIPSDDPDEATVTVALLGTGKVAKKKGKKKRGRKKGRRRRRGGRGRR
jgi:hypothetical protein